MSKVLFVINSKSGNNTTPWEEVISNYFTEIKEEPCFLTFNEETSKASIKQAIDEFPGDKVVAVGGDGTVNMIAEMLHDTKKIMGIIPAGSANGMAKELNIPVDAEKALRIINSGRQRSCDAILINDRDICLHLSDIGLNAQLVKYFDEGKLRGKWGYARMILKTLWYKQKIFVSLQSEDRTLKREAFMVVLANASRYGTGAVINPTGEINDGAFEVVVVRRLAFSELMKMIFKPQPFNPKKIEVIRATSVNIHSRHRAHFQVDGEYKGKIKNLKATILPSYINIPLPPELN